MRCRSPFITPSGTWAMRIRGHGQAHQEEALGAGGCWRENRGVRGDAPPRRARLRRSGPPGHLRSALASLLARAERCGNRDGRGDPRGGGAAERAPTAQGAGVRPICNSANASTPAPPGGPLSRAWRPSTPGTRAQRPARAFPAALRRSWGGRRTLARPSTARRRPTAPPPAGTRPQRAARAVPAPVLLRLGVLLLLLPTRLLCHCSGLPAVWSRGAAPCSAPCSQGLRLADGRGAAPPTLCWRPAGPPRAVPRPCSAIASRLLAVRAPPRGLIDQALFSMRGSGGLPALRTRPQRPARAVPAPCSGACPAPALPLLPTPPGLRGSPDQALFPGGDQGRNRGPILAPSCARTGQRGARSSGHHLGRFRGREHACAPGVCRHDHPVQSSAYRTTPVFCLQNRWVARRYAVPAAQTLPNLHAMGPPRG